MPPLERRYPKEEFRRRGDAIYEQKVEPTLRPKDKGKLVAIDIDSGDFEIAKDELKACDRLRERKPEAQIWLKRVGSQYVFRTGYLVPVTDRSELEVEFEDAHE
jgi:hypothetical protein